MIKCIFAVAAAALALNVSAEVFKCKGSDGRTQFSDTACREGSVSEIMPDRSPVTQQQRQEAQQRAMQMQSEVAVLEEGKARAQADNRASYQRRDAESQVAGSTARTPESNTDAYANCVRDVERRGASQNTKAELIAACRTAGTAQNNKDRTSDTVSECVRSVERTGASETEKARQIAVCHGGDVRPHFSPVRAQRTGSPRNGEVNGLGR